MDNNLWAGGNKTHSPPPLPVRCSQGAKVHSALVGISHGVTSLVEVTERGMCVAESQPSLQGAPQWSEGLWPQAPHRLFWWPLKKGERWDPQLGLGTVLHFPACSPGAEGEWESKPLPRTVLERVLESRLSSPHGSGMSHRV